MNILEEDSLELLKALSDNDVRFILVGGIAVNYYGYTRTTGDVDIWLEDTIENRKKFVTALEDYKIVGAEIYMDYPLIAGYAEIMMNNGVYLDVMADLTGFAQADFASCYDKSIDWEPVEGIHVKVLHINQLIHEKEINNRLKDKDDAEQLKKIRDKSY